MNGVPLEDCKAFTRLRKFKMDPGEANEHEIVNALEKLLMEVKL